MFMTGVLCTVCGAQVYFLSVLAHLSRKLKWAIAIVRRSMSFSHILTFKVKVTRSRLQCTLSKTLWPVHILDLNNTGIWLLHVLQFQLFFLAKLCADVSLVSNIGLWLWHQQSKPPHRDHFVRCLSRSAFAGTACIIHGLVYCLYIGNHFICLSPVFQSRRLSVTPLFWPHGLDLVVANVCYLLMVATQRTLLIWQLLLLY